MPSASEKPLLWPRTPLRVAEARELYRWATERTGHLRNLLFGILLRFLHAEERLAITCNSMLNRTGMKRVAFLTQAIRGLNKSRALYTLPITHSNGIRLARLTALLEAARELSSICDEMGTNYFISGSIAYWALAGKTAEPIFHSDLNLVVANADLDDLSIRLKKLGWKTKSTAAGLRIVSNSPPLGVCIFSWTTNGQYAYCVDKATARIPAQCLRPNRIEVLGNKYNVSSLEHVKHILHLIKKPTSLLLASKAVATMEGSTLLTNPR